MDTEKEKCIQAVQDEKQENLSPEQVDMWGDKQGNTARAGAAEGTKSTVISLL